MIADNHFVSATKTELQLVKRTKDFNKIIAISRSRVDALHSHEKESKEEDKVAKYIEQESALYVTIS